MKCVILAAGIGKRLQPLTNKLPKCLIRIGGMTLLERTLRNVLSAGIREFAIVTGFEERKIRSAVSRYFPALHVTFIDNEHYRVTNNAFSLFLARKFVGQSPFLLLDSDLFLGNALLEEFLDIPRRPNRLAVRVSGQHDTEEIRVRINRWDHVVEIGKHVPLRETYGESVGIGLFSAPAAFQLFQILGRRVVEGPGKTEFYEAAFQQGIGEGLKLWAVDISRFPVLEIDTPEDLERAEKLVETLDHE
ncbi:MAG: phosphocholine cytidylyltransferase family protein [Ignavibacteriales bacterium]|nr:phosphocholine cytidylyltransferase family protein [Ignavibacteriales bacterium]